MAEGEPVLGAEGQVPPLTSESISKMNFAQIRAQSPSFDALAVDDPVRQAAEAASKQLIKGSPFFPEFNRYSLIHRQLGTSDISFGEARRILRDEVLVSLTEKDEVPAGDRRFGVRQYARSEIEAEISRCTARIEARRKAKAQERAQKQAAAVARREEREEERAKAQQEAQQQAAETLRSAAEQISRAAEAQRGSNAALETVLGDLSLGLGTVRARLENLGQLQPSLVPESSVTPDQLAQIIAQQFQNVSQLQVDQLREAFEKLPPEVELFRWVQVEDVHAFYTRFPPNGEPYFYRQLAIRAAAGNADAELEMKRWDARWTLARAAYYKDLYGAFPEKLAENQDLISLTSEQMEILYKTEGVQKAIEWYARAIVYGDQTINVTRIINNQEVQMDITMLDCAGDIELDGFKKKLQDHLATIIFADEPRGTDEQKLALRIEAISAEAIAWNFIYCTNLVESVDSRYAVFEVNGQKRVGERHGSLASVICSDDLRAVFHPQEKYEDKSRNGQRWGAFGLWGDTQIEAIKDSFGKNSSGKDFPIAFEPARDKGGFLKRGDFWTARKGKVIKDGAEKPGIIVKVPECYPTTTMKSLLATYEDIQIVKGKEEKKTMLERLLAGETINWREVPDNAWKTNYLTVRLRKAVALVDSFKGEAKPGWTAVLIETYDRLDPQKLLKEYYYASDVPPNANVRQKEEAGRKAQQRAATHFHNLKVWAVYATQGGVGRPQDAGVFDPYSNSALPFEHEWNRTTHEKRLRKPDVAYLSPGEDLLIKSIK